MITFKPKPGVGISEENKETKLKAEQWGHMPLILLLRQQRQVELCEFNASLVFKLAGDLNLVEKE